MARRLLLALAFASFVGLACLWLDGEADVDPPSSVSGPSDVEASDDPAAVVELSTTEPATDRVALVDDSPTGAVAPDRARVVIQVRERETKAPVPHARAWAFADENVEKECDENGVAVFDVEPGSVSVSAQPPWRFGFSPLMALAYDPETGEPSAERTVDAAAGESLDVTLELTLGGSIRGRVLDAAGNPLPDFSFVVFEAARSRWGDSKACKTDENGAFHLMQLPENWYLISPDPKGHDVFPFEKLHVALGESKHVELRLAPGRLARATIECVQAESGEPYPFRIAARFGRADGVAETAKDWRGPGIWDFAGRPPAAFDAEVRPTRYQVVVEASSGPVLPSGPHFITRSWRQTAYADVDGELEDPVFRITTPKVGPTARVHGLLTRELAPSAPPISVVFDDAAGERQRMRVWFDPEAGDGRFELLVDLSHVPSGRLRFVQGRGSDRRELRTIVVSEGDQSVEITPLQTEPEAR
ncbi:MAG: carboxypeptidase-like regulatory domain-containing protein [Planctomycetota bacterium]